MQISGQSQSFINITNDCVRELNNHDTVIISLWEFIHLSFVCPELCSTLSSACSLLLAFQLIRVKFFNIVLILLLLPPSIPDSIECGPQFLLHLTKKRRLNHRRFSSCSPFRSVERLLAGLFIAPRLKRIKSLERYQPKDASCHIVLWRNFHGLRSLTRRQKPVNLFRPKLPQLFAPFVLRCDQFHDSRPTTIHSMCHH